MVKILVNKFVVNKYITLILEEGKTQIYLNDNLFMQCKFLLIDIPIENVSFFDEFESIDDVIGATIPNRTITIPAETEFWGHCSNLQVWYENDYNSNLLHRNLAFPLLKKLFEVGDVKAKKIFKEEIAKKLESGNESVINYLMEEGYTQYLTNDELLYALLDIKESSAIRELGQQLKENIGLARYEGELGLMIRDKHVIYLSLWGENLKKFPKETRKLPYLEYLDLGFNEILSIPKHIKDLTNLKTLKLNNNQIETIPHEIGDLITLETLELINNLIVEIPSSIKKLIKLKDLNLARNNLIKLHKSIGNLKSLKFLNIGSNKLRFLPDSIGDLGNLEKLSIPYNHLEIVPETLKNLKSLKSLLLNNNNLSKIPISIGGMNSLKFLHLQKNNIKELPNFLKMPPKLRVLDLQYNSFEKVEKISENFTKEGLQVYF